MGIPVIVNSFTDSQTAQASSTITFGPWSLAAGDMVVIAVRMGSGDTVSSVADTAGNTWLSKTRYTNGTVMVQFWYCTSAKANASNTVTFTLSGSANVSHGWLWDVSGQAAGDASDVDAGVYAAGSTSPITSPTFSTAAPNELLLALATFNVSPAAPPVTTFTPSTGWTGDGSPQGTLVGQVTGFAQHLSSAAQLTGVTSSVAYVITTTQPSSQGIAVFSIKGVASITNGSLTLLGCGT